VRVLGGKGECQEEQERSGGAHLIMVAWRGNIFHAKALRRKELLSRLANFRLATFSIMRSAYGICAAVRT
jgi:hypothetical protein